jgi:hypothetical protein
MHYGDAIAADPLTQPLPPAAPRTWAERERRVEWVVRNLTRGEHAMLYRILHDAHGVTRARCGVVERAERTGL